MALLILAGATGKSAQIPLYVWLPDAMEGPTPVSALIHAATMVTAGVYMIARTSAIFPMAPTALAVVAIVGAITALLAASMGVVQNDIKKVLAYSTVSQLGYMFLACGVGAFAAGIFILMTHAFFKGLLFLAAGSVIHALSGEQDMRKMGGLWRSDAGDVLDDVDRGAGDCGRVSVRGICQQGFDSRPGIRENVLRWAVGYFTAGMTAFYMFRLIFMAFHGDRAGITSTHIPHPRIAGRCRAAGGSGDAFGDGRMDRLAAGAGRSDRFVQFLEPLIGAPNAGRVAAAARSRGSSSGQIELMVLSELLVALRNSCWRGGCTCKRTELPAKIAQRLHAFHEVVWHGYYVDEIYDAVFVNRREGR